MKLRLLAVWCGLLTWLVVPLTAFAQDEKAADARFEGFAKAVKVEPSSAAPTWMLFVLLAAICIAVLFKDAKRSHMD